MRLIGRRSELRVGFDLIGAPVTRPDQLRDRLPLRDVTAGGSPSVDLWHSEALGSDAFEADVVYMVNRFVASIRRGPIAHNLGGAAAVQVCLLISGTLSARLLGPENRGYVAILTLWPSTVGQIGAVGMSLAATYFLSSKQIGGPELLRLLRRPATVQVVVLSLITAAIILGYTFISGAPILLAACVSIGALPAALCADYGYAFLLGTRRHGAVNGFRSLGAGLYAAGVAVLFVAHEPSIDAVVPCIVGATAIAGVLVLHAGIRSVRHLRSPDSIVAKLGASEARRTVLAFGRKGYVGYLSPVDTFRVDQLVVGFLISPRALGYYVVAAAFTSFGRSVASNIGLSSTPEVASYASPRERWLAVRRTLLLSGGVLTIITLGLGLLVIVAIPILFGSQYSSSVPVAEILFAAGWLLSMKRITVDAMRGAGEARVGTRAEIVNLVVFLAACGPLGLILGGPGVALALVLASASGSLVLVHRLQRIGVISRSEPTLPDLSSVATEG